MWLVTFVHYEYSELQVARIDDPAKLDELLAELKADTMVSQIEVWEKRKS